MSRDKEARGTNDLYMADAKSGSPNLQLLRIPDSLQGSKSVCLRDSPEPAACLPGPWFLLLTDGASCREVILSSVKNGNSTPSFPLPFLFNSPLSLS